MISGFHREVAENCTLLRRECW